MSSPYTSARPVLHACHVATHPLKAITSINSNEPACRQARGAHARLRVDLVNTQIYTTAGRMER